ALEDIKALEKFTRVLLAAGLLLGFVLIVLLSKRVTGPILALREGALTFGAGNLDHRVDIKSKDEIGELATTFNEMADVIKSNRDELEARVQNRTQELSLLYGVTTQLNQSLDLSKVLSYAIEQIRAHFHFDSIEFFLFDDSFESLVLASPDRDSQSLDVAPRRFRRGEGVVGKVAECGTAAVFEDIQISESYQSLSHSGAGRAQGFRFLAALPIKTKEQTFGVVVFSSTAVQRLSDEAMKLLNAVCEQIAIGHEKSRLFEETIKRSEQLQSANNDLRTEITERERAQQEVSRQRQRIELLHDITSSISRTLDRGILLNTLSTRLENLSPYSVTLLRLFNKTTGRLESVTAGWLDSETNGSIPSTGLSQLVVDQKQILVVEDLQTDPRVSCPDYWRAHGLVSYVGIPLIAENQLLGVLAFYLRQRHAFPKEEIEFLSTLAGQVAIALYNSELYERTRQQAADLEEANKAKDEFLNVMSHELRTPLNVVSGYAQVLDEGVLGDISDEQRHAVQTIIFQSKELLRMINEILQVGSLQAGKVRVDFEDTDLNRLFKELAAACGVLSKKSIALNWNVPPHLPVIRSDGDKLKHILQNLVHNALKFTEDGSVTVSASCTATGVQFKVQDTGVGISEEKLPLIFEMFRQVDSSKTRSYGGAGVGLFIVKRFVELLKGTIEVESKVGHGTTFTVTIPAHVAGASRTEDSAISLPNDLAL
ncbi:MAG: GAF domain-containing protein, partial [Deltaproteobacteria bacterium]|nr:GAF domain-containing protein [Deltaproteobacteria bacterium]